MVKFLACITALHRLCDLSRLLHDDIQQLQLSSLGFNFFSECLTLSSASISTQAKKDQNIKETPQYYHWFALDLFNLYLKAKECCQGKEDKDIIELELYNEQYNVKRSSLDSAANAIQGALELQYLEKPVRSCGFLSSVELCEQELTLTCLGARTLGRFLFDDNSAGKGACLHQAPIRKKKDEPESCDLYVLTFNNRVSPGKPVLVSDVKMKEKDWKVSVNETGLYALGAVTFKDKPKCGEYQLILGLPSTPAQAQLCVYVLAHQEQWRITVTPPLTLSNKALLCTLYAAVQYLCSNPITYEVPSHIPFLTMPP